ncbi:hypothetical protein [Paraburkholderia sartisoli]|uniref:BrnA antitoxin of type II toxin-antitoxin system n=1 Tax=Paraburkholderia sartisoli TaxID=83784 RepID=A0A1H4G7X4_9BURK|nr:hypothetical protein [Paraburkholderia sartisoli]SEB05736.1 hypothetical protein SAMN05192564_105377 [Paraburkholderia sartisoli]
MAMKKFDLEKNKALKLANDLKQSKAGRFGSAATQAAPDRRAQRKLDQEQGLVPFACKLNADLVAQLKERAATHPDGMTGLLTEVLQRGLAAEAK